MKNVIGLAGAIGSGKTAVSDHICAKYGAKQLRYSRILMDVLGRLNLPEDRSNLQTLGESLRRSFGPDVVVNAFRKDLEACPAKIIVVDGIRYPNEVEMLRQLENDLLLYIDAPVEVRYRRALSRAEKGEAALSLKEFVKAGSRETEKRLPDIKKAADYVIENDGTVNSLYSKIDAILAKRLK
jgi:dephospho-CoA kinase